MPENVKSWLWQQFGSALRIHTDPETGESFVWFHEVMALIAPRKRPHQLSTQLWQQPGADTWIRFRQEDWPYRDQGLHDTRGEQN
jgi:hypothetical protein